AGGPHVARMRGVLEEDNAALLCLLRNNVPTIRAALAAYALRSPPPPQGRQHDSDDTVCGWTVRRSYDNPLHVVIHNDRERAKAALSLVWMHGFGTNDPATALLNMLREVAAVGHAADAKPPTAPRLPDHWARLRTLGEKLKTHDGTDGSLEGVLAV